MEPTETITLDRPIILFRSNPKCCVKLTLDGNTPAQNEISKPKKIVDICMSIIVK